VVLGWIWLGPCRNGGPDPASEVSPEWGGVAYSSFDFMFGVAAMQAKVPLTVGKADGLNREKSMFDVKVPMFNNPKLIPITKLPFPNGTNQDVMLFGVGVKGKAIFDEFDKRGGNGVKR
jgi:filamentous hemagglutinin